MEGVEISAGKQLTNSGDTGVRGKLALQFVDAQCTKGGAIVVKRELNRFNYEVEDRADPVSGLTMPVVFVKAKTVDAKEGTPGAFQDKDGNWKVKLDRKELEPDYPDMADLLQRYPRILDKKIYLRLKVVWPEIHAGQIIPCSVAIKGIEFPKGPEQMSINFVTDPESGFVSRFMLLMQALGFLPNALMSDDPTYDPNYLLPYIRDLELPLTEEMVVQRLFVPILQRHATEGHLVRAETSDKSHFVVAKSVKAMSEKDAKKTWQDAQAWLVESDPEQSEEPDPFPGDEPDDPGDAMEAEQLRGQVRTIAASTDNFVYLLAEYLDQQGISYEEESILGSLTVADLQKVIEHFQPSVSVPEKTPAL